MKSSHTCNFFLASCGIPIPIHTSTTRSLIPCEAFYLDLGYIPYLHVSPWLGVKTIHVANSLTSQYSLICIMFVCVCVWWFETVWTLSDDDVSFILCLSGTDLECGDVPLLTPGSKEMMSQALKATFSGFTKEQQRLGIPKGTRMFE